MWQLFFIQVSLCYRRSAPRIDHAALKIVAVLGEIVFDVGQLTSINHVHYLDGGLGKYVG